MNDLKQKGIDSVSTQSKRGILNNNTSTGDLDTSKLPKNYIPLNVNSNTHVSKPTADEDEENWYSLKDLIKKGVDWMGRQYLKYANIPEAVTHLNLPIQESKESAYGIIPPSFTGDTINIGNSRRYILPESINTKDFVYGTRNRGDNTPIDSDAAIITSFHGFEPYGKHSTKYKTYIGIDKEGNLKVGDISNFGEGDLLSGTYANTVRNFKKDDKGNQLWKDGANHSNKSENVPIIETINDKGDIVLGTLNILKSKKDVEGKTYQNITGGRVLIKTGDEIRLVSGSIKNIEELFERMKKRNHTDVGTFYTLDNGSYNRALRTKDKHFTSLDLSDYDNLNNEGGNFIYIKGNKPMKFPSDTIYSPNIRTEESESFKKGHGLKNELKGIVLHHTGDMSTNLNGVINTFMNKDIERSAHAVIGQDGKRVIMADPSSVAFHAGQSVWKGRDNVNDFMLGIEFQGDTNKKHLTELQIASAVEYMKPLIIKNNINLEDIVTHKTVRSLYNEYAKKTHNKTVTGKPDINELDYKRIIDRLLKDVYYKK